MDPMPHQNFMELDGWQKPRGLKKEMEPFTKPFPAEEKYRLPDQMICPVRSINANIAEERGRFTYKDQLHFCIQARGSLSETPNHLIDAFVAGYLSQEQLQYFKTKTNEVGQLLNDYINYFRRNF
jgi:four helix bundle protein